MLPGSGVYSITWGSSARVGGVINAAEAGWEMNSRIVWDGVSANQPIFFSLSSVQPEVVRGVDYNNNLGAIPRPGLTLAYNQSLNLNINSQPPGFTINTSTGDMFIPASSTAAYLDNTAGNAGADYAFSGNIVASDGSSVEFDWLFDAVNTGGNLAPKVDDAEVTVFVGETVNHTFTGSDPDNDPLTWSFVQFFGTAPNSPSFNTGTQAFSWDSTGAAPGTYTALVRVSDGARTDTGQLKINVVAIPQLTLTKSASPDPVEAGAQLVYTLTYQSTGSAADSTGVVIRDTLPPNTTFVSATGGGVFAGGDVTWNLGTVGAGVSGSVSVVVMVTSPLPNGTTIMNSATIEGTNALSGNAPFTSTVTSEPVLKLTKTGSSDPVEAGDQLTYTLSFQNVGTDDATGVVLTDPVPANTTFVSASAGGTLSAGTVTWNLGTLPAGASGSVTMTVLVDSPLADGTVISNSASLSAANASAPAAGNRGTTVTSAPSLELTKSASPDPVKAGDQLTYTLAFANTGTDVATSVVLVDQLPASTTFVGLTGPGTFDLATRTVTWNLGSLGAGLSGSVTVTVQVVSPIVNGTVLANMATIDAANAAAPVDASASATVVSTPRLEMTKSADQEPVEAGANLVYTLDYRNSGSDKATGVTLTDVLPANTSFVSASGGGVFDPGTSSVTWTIGNLAAGASGTVTVTVAVTSPLPTGTNLTNLASLDATDAASASVTETTKVHSLPVYDFSKIGTPDPVQAGTSVTYTVSATNTGNANASGVVVSDLLPANTTFVSATGGGVYDAMTNTVTWNVGALAVGDTFSETVTLSVTSPLPNGTVLTNSASLTSTETAPASVTSTTTVASAPVLDLTKSAPSGSVDAGSSLTYSVVVTNTGTDTATNIAVSDVLPANTTFVSATGGGVYDAMTNTVTWTIPALAAGASVSLSVTVDVAAMVVPGTSIVNTASLTSTETAPGSATAPVPVNVPVLDFTKTASVEPVSDFLPFDYILDYTNSGTGPATNVVIVDALPAEVTFVSATGGGVYDAVTHTVAWNVGTVAAGTSGSVTVTVQVISGTPSGTPFSNDAIISSDQTPDLMTGTASTFALPPLGIPVLGPFGMALVVFLLAAAAVRHLRSRRPRRSV